VRWWFQRKAPKQSNFERLGGTNSVTFLTNMNMSVYQNPEGWWAEDNIRHVKAHHSTAEHAILALYWHIVEHEKEYISNVNH
jgi:hypothetical protein